MSKKRQAHQHRSIKNSKTSKRGLKWVFVAACIILIIGIAVVVTKVPNSHVLVSGDYRNFNFMLITLDTVRADRLPSYGYTGLRAPNLDQLAAESYVFEDAIAQVPLTLPSHTTIMTGRLPVAHGVRDNAGFSLDENEVTLAESLEKAGYATAAFVSAAVLESRTKIDQGFEVYDDQFFLPEFSQQTDSHDVQRRAGDTEIEAEHWLNEHKNQKFFSWVHFYDPHDPYDPPEPYRTEYAQHPYDGEIAYVDEVLGKLMSKLESLQLKERTIVILTGDHGEGLGEHGELTHGIFLYNSTQHVPLIVYIPKGGGGRISGTVSHIDLAPTILELLGVEKVPQMQGQSLIEKMNGKEKTPRTAYSESLYAELHYGWSSLQSITTNEYRYIKAPRPELYDRKADRNDLKNLTQEKTSIAKVLNDKLAEVISKYSSAQLAGPQKMDLETEEKLRALGYIGTTARSVEESRKIDPKDKSDVMRIIQEANGYLQSGRYDLTLRQVIPVLQSDPLIVDAHYIAGIAYIRTGKFDSAIDEFHKTLELQPDDTRSMYNLGYAFELKGRSDDAEFWFLKTLHHNPENILATLKLAHLYRTTNQPEKSRMYFHSAAEVYEKKLEKAKDDKTKAEIYSVLGEIYTGSGQIELAEKNYEVAVAIASKDSSINPDCFVRLGLLYHETAKYEQEKEVFQKMIRLYSADSRGYFYLAKLLLDRKGDLTEVIRLSEKGLSLNPSSEMQVFGHYLLGNAYNLTGRIAESRREFEIAQRLEKAPR
jgi:arylsulfatase A-like enzyme/Tfp pilus assembly protein PilF